MGGLFAIWFLVLVAYFPVFQNRFVYDEHALILQNERILRLSEIPGSFFRFEADTSRQKHKVDEFSRYRPVPEISGILAGQVFGLNPVGWHSVNLMIFFATIGIVFIVLRRIFPDDEVAIAGSALFAIHPVNCEVVAWVVLFGNTLWSCVRGSLSQKLLKRPLSGHFALILCRISSSSRPRSDGSWSEVGKTNELSS